MIGVNGMRVDYGLLVEWYHKGNVSSFIMVYHRLEVSIDHTYEY